MAESVVLNSLSSVEQASLHDNEGITPPSPTSFGRHHTHGKDSLSAKQETPSSPSLWNRFSAWWNGSSSPVTAATPLQEAVKPLSATPPLEPPTASLIQDKLPPSPTAPKWKLTSIEEGIAQMSQHSIDAILFIISEAQLDLEKEHAKIAETTHTKYIAFQQAQQKILHEIKDVLLKDEKVLNYFKTAQNVTLAAATIAGLAAAATAMGVLVPATALVGATCGAAAEMIFWNAATIMATTGSAAAAGMSGLTTAGKLYAETSANARRAAHERHQHRDRYLDGCLENSRNRLGGIHENSTSFQDLWLQQLKRLDVLRKMILKRR